MVSTEELSSGDDFPASHPECRMQRYIDAVTKPQHSFADSNLLSNQLVPVAGWRRLIWIHLVIYMVFFRTVGLFALTALAEIAGCYLPYLWLRKGGSAWLLLPAALSLALFVWLLSLHPAAAGRVYAAYGGVYIAVALVWLWTVDGIAPSRWDLAGATVALCGMAIIVWGGWRG